LSGVEEPGRQLEMFAQKEDKQRKLASVLDRLNQDGKLVVQHGHQLAKRRKES
jgi:hypothetical protein